MRVLLTMAGMIAVGLASQPAAACPCPKEKLIQEYGTVSLLAGAKPRPGPLRLVAVETRLPGPAEAPSLLWPVGEKLQWSGQLADPAGDLFKISLPEP